VPITTDVRKYGETMREHGKKYGETVREQGKSSIDEARKLIRAWVGATDFAYNRVRAELKELPVRNQEQVHKFQLRAKKLNRDQVRKQVKHTYDDMAKRGEKVIAHWRTMPQTRLVFTRAEKGLKHAEEKVEEAEQHVTGRPAGARKAPAHKAPQKGATARH
jgi:hypothetical protein